MPALPAAGVPEIVVVPLLLAVKVSPAGSAPDSLTIGAGKPVVFTLKVNAVPTEAEADADEVITGGCSTVSVKDWDVVPALPFALRVRA